VTIALDASAALAWSFHDERNAYVVAALEYVERHGALVPALWPAEVVQAVLKAERRRRIKEEDSIRLFEALRALPIRVATEAEAVSFPQLALARQHAISAYDATYLAMALRFGIPLASNDKQLMAAAHSLGIGWSPPRNALRARTKKARK